MELTWTDNIPTEEGHYLLRNKAISCGLKRAYCEFALDGSLMQTIGPIDGKSIRVTEIYGHWWFGPIPNPPLPKD